MEKAVDFIVALISARELCDVCYCEVMLCHAKSMSSYNCIILYPKGTFKSSVGVSTIHGGTFDGPLRLNILIESYTA
jgi:hypothetical protein